MEGIFVSEVGRRIKRERIEKGFTLSELAEKSKVRADLVSEIESGSATSSLHHLLALAHSLHIDICDLFKNADSQHPTIIHCRKSEYESVSVEQDWTGLPISIMIGNMPASKVDFGLLDLPAQHMSQVMCNQAFEFIFGIKGKTNYSINGQTVLLEEGDMLFFDGQLPHFSSNKQECSLLILYFFYKSN